MALSSEEIVGKSFSSVRRGYDPDEVRVFLKRIADEGVATRAGTTPSSRGNDVDDAAEEIRSVLIAAREAADKLRLTSTQEAQELAKKAAADADEIRRNATQEATTTLADAKKRAEELVEEAKRYAAEQRSAADRARDQLLDSASREHERLMTEKRELQNTADLAENALQKLRSALKSEHKPADPISVE
jgi:DivIVA domain-containing protein